MGRSKLDRYIDCLFAVFLTLAATAFGSLVYLLLGAIFGFVHFTGGC